MLRQGCKRIITEEARSFFGNWKKELKAVKSAFHWGRERESFITSTEQTSPRHR